MNRRGRLRTTLDDSVDTVQSQRGDHARMKADGLGGTRMGDKGGKKDKDKMKQQHVKKQKQEAQKKDDKARPKTP